MHRSRQFLLPNVVLLLRSPNLSIIPEYHLKSIFGLRIERWTVRYEKKEAPCFFELHFFGCKTVFIRRRLRFNTFRNRFVYYQRHSNHSCKYFAFESLVTIYTLISWLHDWFHIRWERRFWHVFALLHYYTVLNTFFGIMNVVSIYSRNTWKAVI